MNKKTKLKLELEEQVKRAPTENDCPTCKQHFSGSLAKEAHQKIYPSHFGKVVDGTNCHGDESECEKCVDKCPDQREKEAQEPSKEAVLTMRIHRGKKANVET